MPLRELVSARSVNRVIVTRSAVSAKTIIGISARVICVARIIALYIIIPLANRLARIIISRVSVRIAIVPAIVVIKPVSVSISISPTKNTVRGRAVIIVAVCCDIRAINV